MPAAFRLINASPSGVLNLGVGLFGQPPFSFIGPTLLCDVFNDGNTPLIVSDAQVTGPDFSDFFPIGAGLGPFPATVPPNSSMSLGAIGFKPTGPVGVEETATLTFTSNATSGLQTFTLKGVPESNPVACFTAGFASDEGNRLAGDIRDIALGVQNIDPVPGNPAITITLVPKASAGFSLTTPNVLTLNPGDSAAINLHLVVPAGAGLQDITDALQLQMAGGATFTFEVFYVIAPFAPAFTLVGDELQTAVGLSTGGNPSVSYYDPDGLLNNGDVYLEKEYYVDQPHLNKILNRVWLLFERLKPFELTANVSVVNPKNQPSPPPATFSSSDTDGRLGIGCFDLQITGATLELTFSMPDGTGQFSLAGFLMKIDEAGEVIENT